MGSVSAKLASESPLARPIDLLQGVGPTRAKRFRALGVNTLGDLLEYFPRDYQHESAELDIAQLRPEQIQTVRGEVVAVNYIPARPRPRFEATIEDGTGKCALVWFNASWLRTQIHPGTWIRVKGKVRFYRNLPQMAQPKYEVIEKQEAKVGQERFAAIYPASEGLPSDVIARLIQENLDEALSGVEEWFDGEYLEKRKLLTRVQAYRWMHVPADLRQAMSARRRLVYDELILMQLGLGISKRLRQGRMSAPMMRIDKLLDERIRARFPFQLTGAQESAVFDIIKDLQSGQPMNRLLQGDVGSGKTVVALYAMLVAVANRMQSAILAPTEVLAEQHYLTLSNLLRDSAVCLELYTSRTKRASKKITKKLADGTIHLAIGTQALIQEDIEFANLGLVVVDEQHRLGVRQRAILKNKGYSPHYLVMTATPIPRTLALSYFADFDVSTIDELPPGRQAIKTRWLKPQQAGQAYDFLREQVGKGRQGYIVLPQIDDDGLEESKSVLKEYERLGKGALSGLKLAALHGQMATDEKQRIMNDFRDRKIDVLVSTTVIEVGIDMPNATVMIIDNADSFGLSQLHQLRGRVGRGKEASTCILLAEGLTESAQQRLNTLVRTGNGFDIAEMDLQLRGPGEFFGTRQHGLPEFKLADLTSEMALLQVARDDALALLAADPSLTGHPTLKRALRQQVGAGIDLAQIA